MREFVHKLFTIFLIEFIVNVWYSIYRNHGIYNYLLNWRNPENGVMFGEWFQTMKELNEYIAKWSATIEKINF